MLKTRKFGINKLFTISDLFIQRKKRDKTSIHFKAQFRESEPSNPLNGHKW